MGSITLMTESLGTLRTVFSVYRSHCGLLWRIMLPVAIIAIPAYLVVILWSLHAHTDKIDEITENEFDTQFTSKVSTNFGASYEFLVPKSEALDFTELNWKPNTGSSEDASEEPRTNELVSFMFPPGRHTWMLLPTPVVSLTDDKGIATWMWRLSFDRPADSPRNPMTLLLLTLCPLSLAVGHILRRSDQFGLQQNRLTAREAWQQTGRKAWTVLGILILVVLVMFVISLVQDYSNDFVIGKIAHWSIIPTDFLSLTLLMTPFYYIFTALTLYFLVAISLYNPCLILEDNRSVVSVLRRSWGLVHGTKWRFIGIYLLTGWIISVIDSVLMGTILWGSSLFISDLAAVQGALSPLKFLTLIIGADIQILLPQLLSTWVMVAILGIDVLIKALLLPIWAILTTNLYLERVDA
ncbi:MAG: hypothetical protein OXH39_12055 [Candidatus Poribacteria bacterium]|nr:hypothetical protein [Candidatus Poribacteria bacterium]